MDVITNATGAEGGQLNYQRGSTFTFENVTVQAGEGSFDGIVCDELVYRNCTIKGQADSVRQGHLHQLHLR